jgi:hypothetical protein
MTKEKKASLQKYVNELSAKLSAPLSPKHEKRSSGKELKAFLTLEIARTKAAMAQDETK